MIIVLFRIDLFIFYGFTLFLQTLVFPFSLIAYIYNKSNEIKKENNNDIYICI